MSTQDIWLTPEQAATLSGRSMIAVRALIETTLENDGTRHLLQVFDNQSGNYESGYLLHRSLVTSEGLPAVLQSDVVERLSARIQELEAELEVLRFRNSTLRHDIPTNAVPTPQLLPSTPVAPPMQKKQQQPQQSSSGLNASFWTVLGLLILLTFVVVMIILIKQGIVQLPTR